MSKSKCTLFREGIMSQPPSSHSYRRQCKSAVQKFLWHLVWKCCFIVNIRLVTLVSYLKSQKQLPFLQVSLFFPWCLQELHRAAFRHGWVKGGHCLDSAPLQGDSRPHQTSCLLAPDCLQTQEWGPLAPEETTLMLEPRIQCLYVFCFKVKLQLIIQENGKKFKVWWEGQR